MAPANQAFDSPIQVGEIIAGKYRIERVLGVGGMGAVVAARHVDLDELRAIKFMKPEMRTNEQAEIRFMREARAAAKLKSDHVARVHDIGRFETGEPYMVIEYLDGQDLKAMLKRTGPLDPELAVTFILQACEALAEAHAAGIVHRDLKPSNLFVIEGTDGRLKVKVLDFGISKLTGALAEQAGMELTHTSAMMGSPLYMSPEQMASTRDVDARTDVWSLGVIFYRLVTGKRPFKGKTVTSVTISVTTDTPVTPSVLRPDLPEALDEIILHCLEKDPEDRYGSVAALANDLILLAPAHARGLIERIERVAARSPNQSGRFAARAGSNPGVSGSLIPIESGSRELASSDISSAAPKLEGLSRGHTKTSDEPPTVITGDSRSTVITGDSRSADLLAAPKSPTEPGASTAATWQANTESIEVPKHKSRWPLFAGLGIAGMIAVGIFVFQRGDTEPTPASQATTAAPPHAPSTVHPPGNTAVPNARPSAAPTAPSAAALVPPTAIASVTPAPAPRPPPASTQRARPLPAPRPPAPLAPPRKQPPESKDPFGPGWRD